jgi:hypothetical protein
MAAKKTRTIVRYAKRPARHHKKGFTLPLAVVAGLSVPALFLWNNSLKQGDIPQTANSAAAIFTGYNPQGKEWDWHYLQSGLFPVLVGFLAHKAASRLGVNRAIAQAGIPFVRI